MLNQLQIDSINTVKKASGDLLYHGEEAEGTLMETYYRIIEFENEEEIKCEVNDFCEFVVKHNEKYLKWRQEKSK